MARTKRVAAPASAAKAADTVVEDVKEVTAVNEEVKAEDNVTAEEAKASVEDVKEEKASVKKAAPKAEKKTPAKKTAVKKESEESKVSIFLQYGGKQFSEEEIIEKAKSAAAAEAGMKRLSSIKSIEIYCKPEEHAAYYVANGGKIVGRIDL